MTGANGRGIRNAQISLSDSNGNVRVVFSSAFGYYRFTGVPAGATYIFSVSGRRYRFGNGTQVRSINQETSDINFVADN